MPRDVTIPAADGFELAAALIEPEDGSSGNGSLVLVSPATGVKRRLYEGFAQHLVGRGFAVLTWDWRGTGDSRPPGSLRGFETTMTTWATRDLEGVLRWVRRRPEPALAVVGHSFGGQGLGLAASAGDVDAVVTVAAQSGYWGHWPRSTRWLYAILWYAILPPLTRTLGYFPGRRLGLGADLPRGVALEWARWCRSPEYLGDWRGHRRLEVPVLGFGFSDDSYAPRPAVDDLLDRFGGDVERRHRTPAELGVAKIGHFGCFRPGVPALWDEIAEWLTRTLG